MMDDPLEKPSIIELKPLSHISTDAIGPAGQRVFYIQARKDNQVITLIIEKFQLQSLAIGIEQFLAEMRQRFPMLVEASSQYDEETMKIIPPVDPLFRVSEFALNYDQGNDLLGLFAKEIPSEAELPGMEVHFWGSRAAFRAMIAWGLQVISHGRPNCPQCGQPEDPSGHFCARKNGHRY